MQSQCRLVRRRQFLHAGAVSAPLISIVLPTRDRAALLPRAVASVTAQTEANWELIIVDNSAAEPAVTPASLPALGDPRCRVIPAPEARNAGMARNVGLAAATGEWITFLDDDDAYAPEKLAAQRALATRTGSPLVLCGARFHLRGRVRVRHTEIDCQRGDALLTTAGLGTPFLFHRRADVRFDETLFAGEDMHYAHALLAVFALEAVPVAAEPLVDVYQDALLVPRTNLRGEAGWRAACRVWWQFGGRFSPAARRLFVLRARIARAKFRADTARVAQLTPALLRAGGVGQMRFAVNAFLVSAGIGNGRWIT